MNYEKLRKKIKAENGVSLLEVLVSVTLFSFLILSATGIFKLVVDGQRSAIGAQNVQENMRYAMEKMSKEIRMARISNQECDGAAVYKVYNTADSGREVYFKNKNGDCVTYYLENKRLKIMVGAVADFITPAKIEVSNLKFYIADDPIGAFHSLQPYLTMMMDVKAAGAYEQKMKIQMTVSSRYYE